MFFIFSDGIILTVSALTVFQKSTCGSNCDPAWLSLGNSLEVWQRRFGKAFLSSNKVADWSLNFDFRRTEKWSARPSRFFKSKLKLHFQTIQWIFDDSVSENKWGVSELKVFCLKIKKLNSVNDGRPKPADDL